MYNLIEIRQSNIHGKGVFAKKDMLKNTELICDVLVFNKKETILNDYHFPWDKNLSSICIGFGSFFNHSKIPNVKIKSIDKKKQIKTFILLKNIKKGEELTLCYNKLKNN